MRTRESFEVIVMYSGSEASPAVVEEVVVGMPETEALSLIGWMLVILLAGVLLFAAADLTVIVLT